MPDKNHKKTPYSIDELILIYESYKNISAQAVVSRSLTLYKWIRLSYTNTGVCWLSTSAYSKQSGFVKLLSV